MNIEKEVYIFSNDALLDTDFDAPDDEHVSVAEHKFPHATQED